MHSQLPDSRDITKMDMGLLSTVGCHWLSNSTSCSMSKGAQVHIGTVGVQTHFRPEGKPFTMSASPTGAQQEHAAIIVLSYYLPPHHGVQSRLPLPTLTGVSFFFNFNYLVYFLIDITTIHTPFS